MKMKHRSNGCIIFSWLFSNDMSVMNEYIHETSSPKIALVKIKIIMLK